jgi:hypothetical protein
MSIANPLTASPSLQPKVSGKVAAAQSAPTEKTSKISVGVYTDDLLELSTLGLEKQQKETQVAAAKKIDGIANDVVSISSTIGRLRSVDELSHSQATQLYNKIASLL